MEAMIKVGIIFIFRQYIIKFNENLFLITLIKDKWFT